MVKKRSRWRLLEDQPDRAVVAARRQLLLFAAGGDGVSQDARDDDAGGECDIVAARDWKYR